MTVRDWRFHVIKFDGSGGNKVILPDAWVVGYNPTARLSGAPTAGFTFPSATLQRLAAIGITHRTMRPNLYGLVAEQDGRIIDVSIITDWTVLFDSWQGSAIGVMGYFTGHPYRSDNSWINADPAALFRHIIAHVQAWRGANIGLVVDPGYTTDVRIGRKAVQDEQEGPYRLSWYDCQDVAPKLEELARLGGFDYRLVYAWTAARDGVTLRLVLQPVAGRVNRVRLSLGENVAMELSPKADTGAYCTDVMVTGSGEGSKMVTAIASDSTPDTLASWMFVADKNLGTKTLATQRATQHIKSHSTSSGGYKIQEFSVLDDRETGVDGIQLGDYVCINDQGVGEGAGMALWLRVVSIEWSLDTGMIKLTGVEGNE